MKKCFLMLNFLIFSSCGIKDVADRDNYDGDRRRNYREDRRYDRERDDYYRDRDDRDDDGHWWWP